ncbi:uncharacterized protein LOC128883452 isoform X2 [Hylaeus volcanicus]|uniref:uncharacterized protein LOC128883452 isoform X2 n=1 Tax=Hylaeus volcanicus TaxID=313075 RepID=UPI0023B7DC4C|nr:uncharacterized protein LOC128883452 isoform X2 [Hylaeus volcanicus]
MDLLLKGLTHGRRNIFQKVFRKFNAPSVRSVPLKRKDQAVFSSSKRSKKGKMLPKLVLVTVCSMTAYISYPFYTCSSTLKKLDRKKQKTTLTQLVSPQESQNTAPFCTTDGPNASFTQTFSLSNAESTPCHSDIHDQINAENKDFNGTPTVSTYAINQTRTPCHNTPLDMRKNEPHKSTDFVENVPHDSFDTQSLKRTTQNSSLSDLPISSAALIPSLSQSPLHSDSLEQFSKSKDTSDMQSQASSLQKETLEEALFPVTVEMESTLRSVVTFLKKRLHDKKENLTNTMNALHQSVCLLKISTQELQDQEAYLNRKIQHLTKLDSIQKQWFHQQISVQQVIHHLFKDFAKDSFIFQLLKSLPYIYEHNASKTATFIPLKSLQEKIITLHHDALLSLFLSSNMGLTAHMCALFKFFVFQYTGCLLPTRCFAQYSNPKEHARHYQNIHFLNQAVHHASCGNIHESYCNLRQIQGQFPILFKVGGNRDFINTFSST